MQRPAPRPAQPGSLAVPTLPFDSEKNAESARNDSAISKDGLSLLKSSYGSSSSYALTAARLANSETDPRLTTRFNKSKFTIADRWQSVKRYVKTRLLQAPPATASLTNCTDIEHPTSSAKEWSSDTGLVIKHPLKSSTRMSEAGEELETIEVTVVDRDFGDILRGATLLSDSPSQTGDTPLVNGVPSRAGSIATGTDPKGSHAGGRETITGSSNFVAAQHTWRFLRWRIAPPLVFFFYSAFPDPHKEKVYHKESWYAAKTAALASACFLLIAWIATTASQPRPYSLYAKLGYSALGGLTIWPLLPSVAFDVPRKRPILWQILLFCGTWGLPYISLWDMWQCGFYRADNHCQGKDFIGIFYYSLGFPTFALFIMHGSRISEAIGAIVYVAFAGGLIVPERPKFARNLANFILFHIAILWASFLQEKSDRRMFTLRQQLTVQYKATQKAQVAEREASESKRRFVSYIFHEVRVPLNTALLAFQNLDGEGILKSARSDQREMVTGLSSSLISMEKVLNDVLDFNRMEAGKLTWTNKPFNIHNVFRSMQLAFRGVASAREIDLQTDFDDRIEAFSPILLGDEMRFGQIISNLMSNACKFTQNGTVKCVTRLLHPLPPSCDGTDPDTEPTATQLRRRSMQSAGGDLTSLANQHASNTHLDTQKPNDSFRNDVAIIRIEIIDSGVGIRPRDLVDSRLFSAYSQTAAGLRQGGKGSGLGLALVRKIVKLCNGRLGVQSTPNQGSTFWVELALGKPPDHKIAAYQEALRLEEEAGKKHIATSSTPETTAQPIPAVVQAELVAARIPTGVDRSGQPIDPMPLLSPPVEHPSTINALVVDDDSLTRKLMSRMLTRLGHTVTCAEDGLAALNLLRAAWLDREEGRYDIVFLDNQMPICTGVECVREVRRIGMRTFVVGVTGNALITDQQEYLDAGADIILTKPALERNIRDAITTARTRIREVQDEISKRAASNTAARTRRPSTAPQVASESGSKEDSQTS